MSGFNDPGFVKKPGVTIVKVEQIVQAAIAALTVGIAGAGQVVYTAADETLATESGFTYNDVSNTLGVNNASISSFITVGSNPATSGAIRLDNAQPIRWKNGAGTGNSCSIRVDASDNLLFNDSASGNLGYFVNSTKQFVLPTTGSDAGILIGGDTQIYRSAADNLNTPDSFLIGGSSASDYVSAFSVTNKLVLMGNGGGFQAHFGRFSDDASSGGINFIKGRGTTAAATIVLDNDSLGELNWRGAASSNSITIAARIAAEVDGTPGASNDMPGRLVFLTTPNGSGSLTEAMRIDNSQRVIIGGSISRVMDQGTAEPLVQIHGITANSASFGTGRWTNDTGGARLRLIKSRGTTIGSYTIVQNGDTVGGISAAASNGSSLTAVANISFAIDGTPGASNDMPGLIRFSTTPSGSGTETEAMRIDSAQRVILSAQLRLKNYTVATLPAGTQGEKVFVTDALAPTYLATVVGGGAIVTEVFYNGTNWVCA